MAHLVFFVIAEGRDYKMRLLYDLSALFSDRSKVIKNNFESRTEALTALGEAVEAKAQAPTYAARRVPQVAIGIKPVVITELAPTQASVQPQPQPPRNPTGIRFHKRKGE